MEEREGVAVGSNELIKKHLPTTFSSSLDSRTGWHSPFRVIFNAFLQINTQIVKQWDTWTIVLYAKSRDLIFYRLTCICEYTTPCIQQKAKVKEFSTIFSTEGGNSVRLVNLIFRDQIFKRSLRNHRTFFNFKEISTMWDLQRSDFANKY